MAVSLPRLSVSYTDGRRHGAPVREGVIQRKYVPCLAGSGHRRLGGIIKPRRFSIFVFLAEWMTVDRTPRRPGNAPREPRRRQNNKAKSSQRHQRMEREHPPSAVSSRVLRSRLAALVCNGQRNQGTKTQAGSGTKPRNESRGVNRRRREFVSRPPTVVKISRRHAAPEATSSAATPSSAVETTGREEQRGVGRPVARRLCRFDGSKSTSAFHLWR